MFLYLWAFILAFFPPHSLHRYQEERAIVRDVASTDATPLEGCELLNIASFESGFERGARGKLGEVGAFQNLHGDPSAKAALKLLRTQGLLGYMGCSRETEACMRMASNRTIKAIVYTSAFPYEANSTKVALSE
jgi:hypothetical protein